MSSQVKTEQNWLFSISASRLLSECSWPFSFKGETPFSSWRLDLIYRQSDFEFFCSKDLESSVTTTQWFEIPGTLWEDFIKPGLFVIRRFKIFSSLVGYLWIWAKACVSRLDKRSSHCDLFAALGFTTPLSQSIPGMLKSPPRTMVWFEFFGIRSKDFTSSSEVLILESGGL